MGIDYAGTIKGKWILMIVDAYNKYINAHDVSLPSPSETERMLWRTFAAHVCPHVIASDYGSSFTNKEFSMFWRLNGIKHVRCAPYHSWMEWLNAHCQPRRMGLKSSRRSENSIIACLSSIPYISAINNGSVTSNAINGPPAPITCWPNVSRFICQSHHKNRWY